MRKGHQETCYMKLRRNKTNGPGVENRSNAFNRDLSRELLQPTELQISSFSVLKCRKISLIYVSLVLRPVPGICQRCLIQICSRMNLCSLVLLNVSLLDSLSTSWIFIRHLKLNVIKIELIYIFPVYSCPPNLLFFAPPTYF